EYHYSLNENHRLVRFGTGPRAYLTNVLSRLASRFVVRSGAQVAAKKQPFAVEVATFAPHEPYVYAGRDAHRFMHLHAPHTPAFDTDIRVPLIIAGPGIRPGMRIDALADNVDLAPTFEQLAGHTVSSSIDGRSLVPLLEGRAPSGWRSAVLVEHRGPDIDVN